MESRARSDDTRLSGADGQVTVLTVGHSSRRLGEFLDLLRAHDVELLVDVRRRPGSRRHPHFSRELLARGLSGAGIAYEWLGEELGGYRSWEEIGTQDDGADAGLEAEGLRAYAAHLRTDRGAEGLARLRELAADHRTAVMCAERDPERCHRRLIADRLVVEGVRVVHLVDAETARAHRLPEEARLADGTVRYPGSQARLPGLE